MAFINEYIPEADLEKYNFEELNRRPCKGDLTSRQWTIDRDAMVWLRRFYSESNHTELDGGYSGVSVWDFYWKGALMLVEIKDLASGLELDGTRWAHSKLLSINVPNELASHREQILTDLVDAFTAYGGAGVFSNENTANSYRFRLDV